jgi:hypothetical protein
MNPGGNNMKTFYTLDNVGTSKYSVRFHDGHSKNKDGSPFFDLRIFKNKVKMNKFIKDLIKEGYVQTNPKSKRETPVIFRKWKKSEHIAGAGNIIALFPTIVADMSPYHCQSYEHVGQHGAAEPNNVMQMTTSATPSEYADLLKELHKIGYRNLKVVKRLQYSYLGEREKALKGMRNPKEQSPKKVKTKKRGGIGLGGAALIGGIGYLIYRARK